MTWETILYAALFVTTVGVVALAILQAYDLHKTYQKSYLQTLLYQQIFLFSFFLYGVWGNIALREVIADLEIDQVVYQRISLYIPILGTPFLTISWFMLIKFIVQTKGYMLKGIYTISYFTFFTLLILFFTYYMRTQVSTEVIHLQSLTRKGILFLNLLAHLFVAITLSLKSKGTKKFSIPLTNKLFIIYFTTVIIYSVGIWFITEWTSVIIAIIILILFVSSALLPIIVRIAIMKLPADKKMTDLGFEEFCNHFEISKRESEIIKEICLGKSNKDIAESLFITLQTVKDHTHRIYTKTGVNSRVLLANLVRDKIK